MKVRRVMRYEDVDFDGGRVGWCGSGTCFLMRLPSLVLISPPSYGGGYGRARAKLRGLRFDIWAWRNTLSVPTGEKYRLTIPAFLGRLERM